MRTLTDHFPASSIIDESEHTVFRIIAANELRFSESKTVLSFTHPLVRVIDTAASSATYFDDGELYKNGPTHNDFYGLLTSPAEIFDLIEGELRPGTYRVIEVEVNQKLLSRPTNPKEGFGGRTELQYVPDDWYVVAGRNTEELIRRWAEVVWTENAFNFDEPRPASGSAITTEKLVAFDSRKSYEENVALGDGLLAHLRALGVSDEILTARRQSILEKLAPLKPVDVPVVPGEPKLYAVRWTEYERGWGPRPDGFTVYPSKEAVAEHLRAFWAERNAKPDKAPDEYSNPEDAPTLIPVSAALWLHVREKGWTWAHASSTDFKHALTWEKKQ